MNYCQRLKDLREDSDKSQSDIANVLKTSQSYYAQYENGKRELPFYRAIELAKYYDISLDYLAGLIDEPVKLSDSKKRRS